jgi:hypothetical protein
MMVLPFALRKALLSSTLRAFKLPKGPTPGNLAELEAGAAAPGTTKASLFPCSTRPFDPDQRDRAFLEAALALSPAWGSVLEALARNPAVLVVHPAGRAFPQAACAAVLGRHGARLECRPEAADPVELAVALKRLRPSVFVGPRRALLEALCVVRDRGGDEALLRPAFIFGFYEDRSEAARLNLLRGLGIRSFSLPLLDQGLATLHCPCGETHLLPGQELLSPLGEGDLLGCLEGPLVLSQRAGGGLARKSWDTGLTAQVWRRGCPYFHSAWSLRVIGLPSEQLAVPGGKAVSFLDLENRICESVTPINWRLEREGDGLVLYLRAFERREAQAELEQSLGSLLGGTVRVRLL